MHWAMPNVGADDGINVETDVDYTAVDIYDPDESVESDGVEVVPV